MSKQQKLKCPSCGAHNTQSMPFFYATSSRFFRKDNREGMPPEISPPSPRSETVIPALTGGITVLTVYAVLSPGNFQRLVIDSPTAWLLTADGLIALVLGILVSAAVFRRAYRYNRTEFVRRSEIWMDSAICRRCGSTFRVSTGNLVDLTGND